MLLTLNSNRRLFKADSGTTFTDSQRWNQALPSWVLTAWLTGSNVACVNG
ncbi:MAG: hypothetical protein IPJ18_18530 [Betaproteobacteria bacterium]|nr:hypothetical protein [Betaproteobacteria bacterium]